KAGWQELDCRSRSPSDVRLEAGAAGQAASGPQTGLRGVARLQSGRAERGTMGQLLASPPQRRQGPARIDVGTSDSAFPGSDGATACTPSGAIGPAGSSASSSPSAPPQFVPKNCSS